MKPVIFITQVRTPENVGEVHRLVASLRTFGGELANNPVWVFANDALVAPAGELAGAAVSVMPLNPSGAFGQETLAYEFGPKVCACARAEELAVHGEETLVWVDPSCLVVNPPLLYSLEGAYDAAVRPVHLRNVGLRSSDALDAYWRRIFAAVGVADVGLSVESFVDGQRLRAYFNTHAFAVNPARGLLRRWLDLFVGLVADAGFQEEACGDALHRIFLHQAVLSALIAAAIPQDRLSVLPPPYNYPYNLQDRLPPARRAQAFNDLVTLTYEDREIDPQRITDIAVDEPLRSWLAAHH